MKIGKTQTNFSTHCPQINSRFKSFDFFRRNVFRYFDFIRMKSPKVFREIGISCYEWIRIPLSSGIGCSDFSHIQQAHEGLKMFGEYIVEAGGGGMKGSMIRNRSTSIQTMRQSQRNGLIILKISLAEKSK